MWARVVSAAVMAAGSSLVAGSLLTAGPASATVSKGELFYNDSVVGTVVVPAPLPRGGTDPLYVVTNGASGQLGIAGVGPGAPGYHGGAWAVSEVTFNAGVTPFLLESASEVTAAANAGEVTVTRDPAADFRCPIQP